MNTHNSHQFTENLHFEKIPEKDQYKSTKKVQRVKKLSGPFLLPPVDWVAGWRHYIISNLAIINCE